MEEPWKLLGIKGLMVNSEVAYQLVNFKGSNYILSKVRVKEMIARFGSNAIKVLRTVSFEDLIKLVTVNPLNGNKCKLYEYEEINDKYGTGIDPLSPCNDLKGSIASGIYKLTGIDILDKNGRIESVFGKPFEGVSCVDESGNEIVRARLKELNRILWEGKCEHVYSIEKSSGKRALIKTFPTWYLKLSKNIRSRLLRDLMLIDYAPKLEMITYEDYEKKVEEEREVKKKEKKQGKKQIKNHFKAYYRPLIEILNDQEEISISEVNPWSIPIPVFKNIKTGDLFTDQRIASHIATKYKQEGSDCWYSSPILDLLPEEYKSKAGELEKTYESFDSLFIGAMSPYYLAEKFKRFDMTTECYSQQELWMNRSTFIFEALKKKLPFHILKTHGNIVDAYGDMLHDFVYPIDIIEGSVKMDGKRKYGLGTDVLRAWVSMNDTDSNVSLEEIHLDEINKQIKKIRIELERAFLLLENNKNQPSEELNIIDLYILQKLFELTTKLKSSYEEFSYKDVIEDISLYVTKVFSDYLKMNLNKKRSGTKYTIGKVLNTLARIIQPVLPYLTAELFECLGISFIPQELQWPEVKDIKLPIESLDVLNNLFELKKELSLVISDLQQKSVIKNTKSLLLVMSSNKNKEIEGIDYNLEAFFNIGHVAIVDELKIDTKNHLKRISLGKNKINAHLQKVPTLDKQTRQLLIK